MSHEPSNAASPDHLPTTGVGSFLSQTTADEFARRRHNPFARRRHDPAETAADGLLADRELGRYYAILRHERQQLSLTEGQWRLLWLTVNGWLMDRPEDAATLADGLYEVIALDEAADQAGVSETEARAFADEISGWSLARSWAAIDWLKADPDTALGNAAVQ